MQHLAETRTVCLRISNLAGWMVGFSVGSVGCCVACLEDWIRMLCATFYSQSHDYLEGSPFGVDAGVALLTSLVVLLVTEEVNR